MTLLLMLEAFLRLYTLHSFAQASVQLRIFFSKVCVSLLVSGLRGVTWLLMTPVARTSC